MLVDPFNRPEEVWPTVLNVIESVWHKDLFGAIEVFAYGEQPVDWPPLEGFSGRPIATISRKSFQLATYATHNFRATVESALSSVGWQV